MPWNARLHFLGLRLRCTGTATSANRTLDRAVRYSSSSDASADADDRARGARHRSAASMHALDAFACAGGRCGVCGGYCDDWGGHSRALVVSLTSPDQSLRRPGAPLRRTGQLTSGRAGTAWADGAAGQRGPPTNVS